MFKEWLKFYENSELQRDEFKKVVSKHFPASQFHATKDGVGVWVDVEFAGRIAKLTWEKGLPRLEKDPKTQSYKPRTEFDNVVSNVYISVVNKDAPDEEASWRAADALRPGSLDFVKKMKAMVQELTSAGMTIEYLPSDPRNSKFYKKSMNNMGMKRITGTNYWTKQVPPGLTQVPPPPANPRR